MMTRLHRPFVFGAALVAASLGLVAADSANRPPPDARVPDLSTIPGAVTKGAAQFDLEGTGFIMRDAYWMAIDVEQGSEAQVTHVPELPDGKYTFILEVPLEATGDSTYWLELGEERLPEKTIPAKSRRQTPGYFPKLMWTEIPYAEGTPLTIGARAAMKDGTPVTYGYWSRLIILPHGGPTMPGPPPPRGGVPNPGAASSAN